MFDAWLNFINWNKIFQEFQGRTIRGSYYTKAPMEKKHFAVIIELIDFDWNWIKSKTFMFLPIYLWTSVNGRSDTNMNEILMNLLGNDLFARE